MWSRDGVQVLINILSEGVLAQTLLYSTLLHVSIMKSIWLWFMLLLVLVLVLVATPLGFQRRYHG